MIKYRLQRFRGYFLLLILSVSFTFCTFNSEPEKIWNLRGKVVALAESLKGIPYHYGGTDIDGFDCSGFVSYVYDCFGVEIPRTAKQQGKMRPKIKFKHAKQGDIVVFKLKRNQWHSGLFITKFFFIHSPNGRGVVRKEPFSKYWKKKLEYTISILDER